MKWLKRPAVDFLKALLTWHVVGAVFGAVGLGLGSFAVTVGRSTIGEVVAGTMMMGVYAVFAACILTPLGLLVLAAWAILVRWVPSLEQGAAVARAARLSVVAALLTVPFIVAMWTLLGMRTTEDTRSAIVVVWGTLRADWPITLMYLPAVLGWFVLPRLTVRSLRTPILRPPEVAGLAPN